MIPFVLGLAAQGMCKSADLDIHVPVASIISCSRSRTALALEHGLQCALLKFVVLLLYLRTWSNHLSHNTHLCKN